MAKRLPASMRTREELTVVDRRATFDGLGQGRAGQAGDAAGCGGGRWRVKPAMRSDG
jgi:hypothetical protein